MDIKIITPLLSIFFFIGVGYLARTAKVLDIADGRKIVKFLFVSLLPILIFFSFLNAQIEPQYLYFPLISIFISSILMIASYFLGKLLGFEKKTIGTLIIASGITSTLLVALPFISAFYGPDSLKYLFLYDVGNGLMAWTAVFFIAGLFSNKEKISLKKNLITFLKTPALIGIFSGLALSLLGVHLPESLKFFPPMLSGVVNPLLLICIGIFLEFKYFKNKSNLLKIFLAGIIVIGISFFIALAIVNLLGITGIPREIILISAIAPCATLTVVFSVEHDLDVELAGAIVPFTMALGIILIPLYFIFVSNS